MQLIYDIYIIIRRSIGRRGIIGVLKHIINVLLKEGFEGIQRKYKYTILYNKEMMESGLNMDMNDSNQDKVSGYKVDRNTKELLSGALLVGHPYGILGMGEHIRSSARSFYAANIPFHIRNTFDIGEENKILHKDFPLMNKIVNNKYHKANIFYINADEMDHAYRVLGNNIFKGKYNIGYWLWELSKFPDEWCNSFSYLDELWAPSRFIQQSISEKTDCPVIRMPLAVENNLINPLPRKYFRLPNNVFLFMFFFDFTSYITRKNPMAVIKAYEMAFRNDNFINTCLVIKTNGMGEKQKEFYEFKNMLEQYNNNIILFEQVMSDYEIKSLVNSVDCFVSLHRSEGFGFGPAEAMSMGKPAIVTGYSGNMDYSNDLNSCIVDYQLVPVKEHEYPYGDGQVWAEPDIEQAAWYMRKLVKDKSYTKKIGESASQYIRDFHSYPAIGQRYRHRLQRIGIM